MLCLLVGVGASWAETFKKHTGLLSEGDYIIVYSTNALKASITSGRFDNGSFTENNGVISNADASIVWHLAKNGLYWTLYNESAGKYAGGNNTKNQGALLDNVDNFAKFSVTDKTTSTTYEFENFGCASRSSNTANRFLRNNATNGWACYSSTIGGEVTLYKKESSTPTTPYTVTFKAGSNGTCSTTSLTEASAGAGVTLPSVTANNGYVFKGWATSSSATSADAGTAGTNYKPSSDCTLYAVYGDLYTVTLSDDPSMPLAQTEEGGLVTLPSRTGNSTYSFAGWSTTNLVSETSTEPLIIPFGNYKPTENVTLYPVFVRTEEGDSRSYTYDFENTSVTGWTNQFTQANTTAISPHGGTYWGSVNVTSAKYLQYNPSITGDAVITAYCARTSDNSNNSTFFIQTKTATGSWITRTSINVGTTGSTDEWQKLTWSGTLATEQVRIYYTSSTTAIRALDDVNITVGTITRYYISTIPAAKTPTSLSWSATAAEVTMGAENNTYPTLTTTPADLTGVTYTSSNSSVATINATTGAITLIKDGETTITASYDGNETYAAAEDATYTLTVKPAPDTRAEVNLVSFTTTDDATSIVKGNTLVTSVTNDQAGWTAAYTYASSNNDVATVSNEGVITAVAKGTATITASLKVDADDASYKAGSTTSKSIEITVTNPTHTATFYANSVQYGEVQNVEEGEAIAFPTGTPDDVNGKTFVGWTAAVIDGTQDTEPSMVSSATMGAENVAYYAVFALKTEGTASEPTTDDLNLETTGVTGSSYTAWDSKTVNSSAVYAGNNAGGNSSIQLRSKNNDSGIITTTSGGNIAKVRVEWNNNTTNGRALNVYGSNNAYNSPADLYDDETAGTLIGTITYSSQTSLAISDEYAYVGVRSNDGALYLNSVTFTWIDGTADQYSDYCTTVTAPKVVTGIVVKTEPTTAYCEGEHFNPAGLELTVSYEDGTTSDIAYTAGARFTFEPALDAELQTSDKNVTITYGDKTTTLTINVRAVSIAAPGAEGGSYTVKVGDAEAVTADDNTIAAKKGQKIVLAYTLEAGYKAQEKPFVVTDEDGKDVAVSAANNQYSFDMPGKNVTIAAKFAWIYYIAKSDCENGQIVDILDKDNQHIDGNSLGSTVKVVVKPAEHYHLSSLYYIREGKTEQNAITKQESDNVYTFTMVKDNITVYAEFEEDENCTITYYVNGVPEFKKAYVGEPIEFPDVDESSIPSLASGDGVKTVFKGWIDKVKVTDKDVEPTYITSAPAEGDATYFAVFATETTTEGETGSDEWVKVTSDFNDWTASGNQYVLVFENSNGTGYVFDAESTPNKANCTISGNKITSFQSGYSIIEINHPSSSSDNLGLMITNGAHADYYLHHGATTAKSEALMLNKLSDDELKGNVPKTYTSIKWNAEGHWEIIIGGSWLSYPSNDFRVRSSYHNPVWFYMKKAATETTTEYSDFTTNMDVIERTAVQDKYFTICYPYAVHPKAYPGATAYNIVGKTMSGDRIATLELEEVADNAYLEAGHPYFMVGDDTNFLGYHSLDNPAAEAGNHNGLYGVFPKDKNLPLDAKENGFAFSEIENFVANEYYVISSNKVQAGTQKSGVNAYRAYIKKSEIHEVSNQSAARFVIELEEGTLTELDEVELKPIETSIYNLQGQRINRTDKGVYIVNGRKVIR